MMSDNTQKTPLDREWFTHIKTTYITKHSRLVAQYELDLANLNIIGLHSYGRAIRFFKQVYDSVTELTSIQDYLIKPYEDVIEEICSEFGNVLDRAYYVAKIIEDELIRYQKELYKIRYEEEINKRRKVLDESCTRDELAGMVFDTPEGILLDKKLNREARKKPVFISPVFIAGPVMSYIEKSRQFDIVDTSRIPREYCVPDYMKIDDAIQKGATNIPGVQIYTKKHVVVQ